MSLALLPGALTAWFAVQAGGYFPGVTALVAAELAIVVILHLATSKRPLAGVTPPLAVAAVSLGLFAIWTASSSSWSGAIVRAAQEYDRVVLYLFALLAFGLVANSARRVRWMLYGFAAAAVGICAVAFISRTMPDLILDVPTVHPDRLSYPLGYWNTLGLLAALGIVVCGHLASSVRDPWPARVLGAASIPMLSCVLYYTFSRGATWVALGGVAIYIIMGRSRGLATAALATVPTTAMALMAANPANVLTAGDPLGDQVLTAGRSVATTVAIAVLGAALLRVLLLPADTWLREYRLPERIRRPVLICATALLAATAVAGFAALDVPGVVDGKYDQFASQDTRVPGPGSSRLFNAGDNGRQAHWDVAKAALRRDSGHGSGAGTYEIEWARERTGSLSVRDGHSLYYEVLGELGWPGMLALGVTLILILGAFAVRARGPDRAMYAALFAAGAAWAAHAGLDWDWEMPVVTVWLFAFGGAALAKSRAWRPAPRPSLSITFRTVGIAGCIALAIMPATFAVADTQVDRGVGALHAGDCPTASAYARSSLATFENQTRAHHLLAFCHMQAGRYAPAVQEWKLALLKDPQSWQLQTGLAVAQASAGRDPRVAAQTALRLNPLSLTTQKVAQALSSYKPREWVALGRSLPVTPP